MKEWTRFHIGTDEPLPRDTAPLNEVHHIVHLRISRRVLEDRQLRAGLIHDESKLNKSRLCVVWLSANFWHNGSIYGTVRFTYEWAKLIENRSLYWVEEMNYPNAAYRLLVTDQDLQNSKRVTPYDPKADDGPIVLRDGKWFWNSKYTSEFMIESDLDLKDAQSISFVEHSNCRERRGCKEETINPNAAGAQTIAFVLGNNIHCIDHLLVTRTSLNDLAEQCVLQLWLKLGRTEERFGGVLRRSKSCEDVLLGVLALFGSGQITLARETVKTLRNQEVFTKALTSIVRKHFRLPFWEMAE